MQGRGFLALHAQAHDPRSIRQWRRRTHELSPAPRIEGHERRPTIIKLSLLHSVASYPLYQGLLPHPPSSSSSRILLPYPRLSFSSLSFLPHTPRSSSSLILLPHPPLSSPSLILLSQLPPSYSSLNLLSRPPPSPTFSASSLTPLDQPPPSASSLMLPPILLHSPHVKVRQGKVRQCEVK